ncbi:hypothetical protein FF098_007460 [Parvularcula flava]|uniref:Uncharacterized protein n=1 Tax=Aquisalinus luteolus TaxID=1566827 RepID=A0A8J3A1V7_9PROT|nr:hypothetical protein [Aquisalinus luteolus]NHK27734.1 hypothetical protein [Aquisalinus luteolus]GGH96337.1 hypothetical protein GCM10011355_15000 [Aquisalinus luteolus]
MDAIANWLNDNAGYFASYPALCDSVGTYYVFWFALISPVVIYLAGNLWGVLTDSRPGNTLIPLLVSVLLGILQFAFIQGCADPLTAGGYTDELIRTTITVILNYFVAFSGQNLLFGRNREKPSSETGSKRRGWIDPW